ncbi:MAG: putative peptidoglycan glycosyltransferase FtsW [Candidatus Aminicenantales bacterium]|jgi:cell division protein FtsW
MEMVRRFGFDKTLFLIALILVAAGVLMVFDASGALANKYHQPFYFLFNQLGGAVGGIILLFAVISIKVPFYENRVFVFGLLGITYVLLALCFAMPEVANTHRWLNIARVRFQPSELAKLSLILFLANYVQWFKDRINELKIFLPAAAVLFAAVLLILLEPDFGTAALTMALGGLVLFLGGARLRHFLYLGAAVVPTFFVFLLLAHYRITRVLEFFAGAKDLDKASFQVAQSKLAVGAGGVLGTSLGEGTQKLFFLPCPHTDFIFSVIAEELGLLGALSVLALFAIIIWRGLSISFKATTMAAQLTAAGVTFMLALQTLINISVVLGLSPAKGVPLPLISFGRSSLVCTILALAILLHISQRKGEVREY